MYRRLKRLWLKYLIPMLATAVALQAASLVHAQQDSEQTLALYPSGSDAIPILEEVWNFSVDNIFPEDRSKFFERAAYEKLERELRANNELALADLLNPFLDRLGVSHTQFYDRRHQTYYMLRSLFSTRDPDAPQLYTTGLLLNDKEPGLVNAILEGSPASDAGFRRGDRIVKVDGEPFSSLLQWQRAGPVRLAYERTGTRGEVELKPVLQGFHRALANATMASRRIIECQNRRIAYLHLWSGTNEVFLNTLQDFVSLARSEQLDGFVLDLRDGYGGAWYPYLDPFFPDRNSFFVASVLSRDGKTLATADARVNSGTWDGPLAVITNSGTRSGKESMAHQFKTTGRGTLFGSTTRGAFTAGMGVFAERDVDYLLYLSVSEIRLDDTVIEGKGIEPDVVVAEGASRDAPLASALHHLGCQAGAR